MVNQTIAIIGGGPAGLMAAEVLSQGGAQVDIYDAMPSVGRKFLRAGTGGLNIAHSEPFEKFIARYGSRRVRIEPLLRQFGPNELRNWVQALGFETFVGTSGRVFPVGMKASPLLRAWLKRLQNDGVNFHVRHKWVGWDENRSLKFTTPEGNKIIHADAVVLALGGGSWRRLGSDGAWVNLLEQAGVRVEALKPSNCGFDVAWSEHFRNRFDGEPLKSVILSFKDSFRQQGEFIVTRTGVEGSLIYAASAGIRDEIDTDGKAFIQLDLAPDFSLEQVIEKLSRPRGSKSLANFLEKTMKFRGLKIGLLREFISKEDFNHPETLGKAIKGLAIPLITPRPLDEAISTAGGVPFEGLDSNLMLKKIPGVFCAGEMLDWEAPTGGYLLTACFSSGRAAGFGVSNWLHNRMGSKDS
jgi:uncharacterized flavoprotein (TIGR03862 family)